MNKFEAAEKLAAHAEMMCTFQEAFTDVPTIYRALRERLKDYKNAPAIPPLEKILEAMEVLYAVDSPGPARVEAIDILISLRKAVAT